MFLNSGNGVVFRGALGPWYSEEKKEYHLNSEAAADLVAQVLKEYSKDHDKPPAELFIHARQRFSAEEWNGFESAVSSGHQVRRRPHPAQSGLASLSPGCSRSGAHRNGGIDIREKAIFGRPDTYRVCGHTLGSKRQNQSTLRLIEVTGTSGR
jgi:hypothetical protein